MKNIGTKSINMSDIIIIYVVMFGTTNYKILYFIGPQKMKMIHYSLVLDSLWDLAIFIISIPPNFEIFLWETWSHLDPVQSFAVF